MTPATGLRACALVLSLGGACAALAGLPWLAFAWAPLILAAGLQAVAFDLEG